MKLVFQIGLEDNLTNLTIVMNWSDVPPFVKYDFQINLEDQFRNATRSSQYNDVLPIVKFVFFRLALKIYLQM